MKLLRTEFSRYFAVGFAVAAALVCTFGTQDGAKRPIADAMIPVAQAAELN